MDLNPLTTISHDDQEFNPGEKLTIKDKDLAQRLIDQDQAERWEDRKEEEKDEPES